MSDGLPAPPSGAAGFSFERMVPVLEAVGGPMVGPPGRRRVASTDLSETPTAPSAVRQPRGDMACSCLEALRPVVERTGLSCSRVPEDREVSVHDQRTWPASRATNVRSTKRSPPDRADTHTSLGRAQMPARALQQVHPARQHLSPQGARPAGQRHWPSAEQRPEQHPMCLLHAVPRRRQVAASARCRRTGAAPSRPPTSNLVTLRRDELDVRERAR